MCNLSTVSSFHCLLLILIIYWCVMIISSIMLHIFKKFTFRMQLNEMKSRQNEWRINPNFSAKHLIIWGQLTSFPWLLHCRWICVYQFLQPITRTSFNALQCSVFTLLRFTPTRTGNFSLCYKFKINTNSNRKSNGCGVVHLLNSSGKGFVKTCDYDLEKHHNLTLKGRDTFLIRF